jgi:hypothetical protein
MLYFFKKQFNGLRRGVKISRSLFYVVEKVKLNLEVRNWLMNQIPSQLNKLSLTKDEIYDSLSRLNDATSWRVFVRKALLDKNFRYWLESVKRDCNLKIDANLKKGFLVIY